MATLCDSLHKTFIALNGVIIIIIWLSPNTGVEWFFHPPIQIDLIPLQQLTQVSEMLGASHGERIIESNIMRFLETLNFPRRRTQVSICMPIISIVVFDGQQNSECEREEEFALTPLFHVASHLEILR